jgi:hypothetical protein
MIDPRTRPSEDETEASGPDPVADAIAVLRLVGLPTPVGNVLVHAVAHAADELVGDATRGAPLPRSGATS